MKPSNDLAASTGLPEIFKTVLNTRDLLVDDELVIDHVLMAQDCPVETDPVHDLRKDWKPATLILATNYGLILLEEGGVKIADDFYGYNIIHLMYEKIHGIALDICLLQGRLKIFTTCARGEIVVDFNTAVYHREFERFLGNVRKLVMKRAAMMMPGPL